MTSQLQVDLNAPNLQQQAEKFWEEIKDIKIPDVTTGKTTDQIIEDILEHEKVNTGIDWKAAAAGGPGELKVAADKAHAHLNSLKSKLSQEETERAIKMGILQANGEIPPVMAMLTAGDSGVAKIPDGAAPFVVWGWNPKRAKEFQDAQGDKIKALIANLIRNFQVMREDSTTYMVKTLMNMGLWGFGFYGLYQVFKIIRALGALGEAEEAFAVLGGILEVGSAVIMLGITVVILAVLVPLFVLMSKDAAGIMVIINDTDQDLVLEDITCTHGKIIAIFKENPDLENPQPIIPKTIPAIVDPKTGKVVAEGSIQAGFFSARKSDMALAGTQGALKFNATTSFPQGAYIGWSVPLAIGDNSLLVAATFDGSVSQFSDKTGSHGKQGDTSMSTAKANITGRVNSGSGSEAYYIINLKSQ